MNEKHCAAPFDEPIARLNPRGLIAVLLRAVLLESR